MPRSARRRTIEVPTWLYGQLTAEATRQDRTLADLCLEFLIRGLNQADQRRSAASPLADARLADDTPSESQPTVPARP
jgi:hypothetical protein